MASGTTLLNTLSNNHDIILVDLKDVEIGTSDKITVHHNGLLHRAFSIFLFNEEKECLLQKRALSKYHSPGLWSNACCSHPFPGENIKDAAQRRLMEELGVKCELVKAFHFIYQCEFENGLKEHEFDHVFFGQFNGSPEPNPKEVLSTKWHSLNEIQIELIDHPEQYTYWLKMCFERVLEAYT